MKPITNAFTIIEISIVLVIVSIIIGIILVSGNLIKIASYRAIISDSNYYLRAVDNFSLKYNALPGDINNSSQYNWRNVNGNLITDGNNDGKIGLGDGSDPIGESIRAWAHLSISGTIKGNYTGESNGTPIYLSQINTPITPLEGSFYSLYYFDYTTGIYGKWQNALAFAALNPSTNIPWANSILTPSDAYQIDSKADDGSPYTGQIYTIRGEESSGLSKCVSADYSSSSASYLFNDNSISCRLLFWVK
ncbi:MAG: prepilin-type N-terminal cleavage/methylation domain-containing protein [Alphaproteobacteria bacterium]